MGFLEGSGVPVLYIYDARFLKVNVHIAISVQLLHLKPKCSFTNIFIHSQYSV
jgi:hypothetical protein